MEVTELGIEMSVRLVHSEKALLPMEVTEPGIEISVRLVHQENALLPIIVIPCGIWYCEEVRGIGYQINLLSGLLNKTPSIEARIGCSGEIVIFSRE